MVAGAAVFFIPLPPYWGSKCIETSHNKDAGCNGQRAAVSGVCLFFIYGLCTFRHFYDFFIPRLPVLCVQNTNSFMMDDVPLAAPMTHKFYNHHLPDNTNILLQNNKLHRCKHSNATEAFASCFAGAVYSYPTSFHSVLICTMQASGNVPSYDSISTDTGTKFPTYRHIIISTATGIGGDADAAK